MLKSGYTNGSNSGVTAVLRHRPTRHLATWILLFLIMGSMWYILGSQRIGEGGSPSQTSVIVHKTEGELDVLRWPEERWFEGPRNESQLEKAALVMLVRYTISSRSANRRNSELHAARSAMREVEDRFNKRFGYPWVFVNDEPFTDEYDHRQQI